MLVSAHVGIPLRVEQCAERFYGLAAGVDGSDIEDDGSAEDIERLIRKEITHQQNQPKLFRTVKLDIPCVLFIKTRPPINPVHFVHRICQEVVSTPGIRKMRYVNRLTPMTLMGKATEKGLDEVAKTVLDEHFHLHEKSDRNNKGVNGDLPAVGSVSVSLPRSSAESCLVWLHQEMC